MTQGPWNVTVVFATLLPVASATVALICAIPGFELLIVTAVEQWLVASIVQVVELSVPKSVANVTTAPSSSSSRAARPDSGSERARRRRPRRPHRR
jgi:hypothetical protein